MGEREEEQSETEPVDYDEDFCFFLGFFPKCFVKGSLWMLFGEWAGREQEWKPTSRKVDGMRDTKFVEQEVMMMGCIWRGWRRENSRCGPSLLA